MFVWLSYFIFSAPFAINQLRLRKARTLSREHELEGLTENSKQFNLCLQDFSQFLLFAKCDASCSFGIGSGLVQLGLSNLANYANSAQIDWIEGLQTGLGFWLGPGFIAFVF